VSHNVPQSLDIDKKAPDFELPDEKNNMVQLSILFEKGPVVLSFYRGDWCIHCNKELKDSIIILTKNYYIMSLVLNP
jgi:peroxiredoxin